MDTAVNEKNTSLYNKHAKTDINTSEVRQNLDDLRFRLKVLHFRQVEALTCTAFLRGRRLALDGGELAGPAKAPKGHGCTSQKATQSNQADSTAAVCIRCGQVAGPGMRQRWRLAQVVRLQDQVRPRV